MAVQPVLGRAHAISVRPSDVERRLFDPASAQTDSAWLTPDNQWVEWVTQEVHAADTETTAIALLALHALRQPTE